MPFGGVSIGFQWVLAERNTEKLNPTEISPTGKSILFIFFSYFELFCMIVIFPYKLL